MDIIKASGEREKFSKKKLCQSLKRAGAGSRLADRVCREVSKFVRPGIDTEKILDKAFSCLRKKNPILAARYNLKRAIMELGPTGFPFEQYIAQILREYGYAAKVGKLIRGRCATHEIDVVAAKSNRCFMIECKYHNNRGIRSDEKVALYVYARFLDVKKIFRQAWLVTNTRCTNQAVRYAKCVGLRIISWRYPQNEGLEYLIEKKGLYPITILPSLNRETRERLAQKKIMLAKDLLKYPANTLAQLTGLRPKVIKRLREEAERLCFY
jgi:Holliday junction resolvase-like predicted endonuclease